jgi:ribulose-phosphate 3-epimerase
MNSLIPTIFAHNKKEFSHRLQKLLQISRNLQIDFMDGKFVKSRSVSLSQIPNLKKYKNNFEAHLMVSNPHSYIKKLKQKGFKKIIFHYESKNPEKTLQEIKRLKLILYLAINPETKLEKVIPFILRVKGVLFMGVHPGKEHQDFIPGVYAKIKKFRERYPKLKIQVDGGANDKTIVELAKLGVNYINSGSYVYNSKSPGQTLKKLNNLYNKYKQ